MNKVSYPLTILNKDVKVEEMHYNIFHVLLAPDGNNLEDKKDFVDTMWKIHYQMMNIALMNAKPLLRWLTSIVIILHKDIGKPKIHILRLINTYEADYIFIFGFFSEERHNMETERAQLLGSNQRRGRKDMSVVETSVINKLILETHRIRGKMYAYTRMIVWVVTTG